MEGLITIVGKLLLTGKCLEDLLNISKPAVLCDFSNKLCKAAQILIASHCLCFVTCMSAQRNLHMVSGL